jgi:hypothetical protein
MSFHWLAPGDLSPKPGLLTAPDLLSRTLRPSQVESTIGAPTGCGVHSRESTQSHGRNASCTYVRNISTRIEEIYHEATRNNRIVPDHFFVADADGRNTRGLNLGTTNRNGHHFTYAILVRTLTPAKCLTYSALPFCASLKRMVFG